MVKYIFSVLLGFIVGVSVAGIYALYPEAETKLLIAKKAFRTDSGIVIPKGTVLVNRGFMPEGYLMGELSIAIEGDALKYLQHETGNKSNISQQYFVYK